MKTISEYDISFYELAAQNYKRCRRWHPKGINEWSLSDWGIAAAGEMGEACNVIKKLNRLRDGLQGNKIGEMTETELKEKLGDELADTIIYLDLIAARVGLSLAECVRRKFNAVSNREGFPEKL